MSIPDDTDYDALADLENEQLDAIIDFFYPNGELDVPLGDDE